MFSSSDFTPSVFEGKGEIELRGKKISYHTVSEDNVIYDNEGKAIASIFSFSYFRDGVEDTASRPVIFGFNGGPGTSSCMVHTGFLGPKRLKYKEDVDDMTGLPPYETVDNPECLLDIADYRNGLAMQKYRPAIGEVGLPVLKIKELRQGNCDATSELCSPNINPDYIIHDTI